MPQPAGKKAVLRIEVQIQAGSHTFFVSSMRKSRRHHRFVRRLIFAKSHVAVNAQKRSAHRLWISDEVRADRIQLRTKIFNELEERIAHTLVVARRVLLKPFAVVVLVELPEELKKFRREVGVAAHWNSLKPGDSLNRR